jgi:hypothetical protein
MYLMPNQICHAILSHSISPMPSVIPSPWWHLHHCQHDIYPMTYLPYHIISIMPYYYNMPYLMPYPSWRIHNYRHDIYPMPCLPCQTIYGVPYYPIPHITCHLSYHLNHGISIITNNFCSPMPYLTHVISCISCHILPCYFSHDLYHIIYLLFHIFCDTSLVPYVPVLIFKVLSQLCYIMRHLSCDTLLVPYIWWHLRLHCF